MSTSRFLLLACALLALSFGPHLGGAFVWDDVPLVRDNPVLRGTAGVGQIFTRDLWGGAGGARSQLYHPLPMLSLWLHARAFGLGVVGLRLANLLLHGLAVGLLVTFLLRERVPRGVALATGALVLVHPSVTEPVLWITGRHDTLGVLAVLGALLVWRSAAGAGGGAARALASGLLLALAFLSKEPYVVGPLVLLGYAASMQRERFGSQLVQLVLSLVPLAAAIALRLALGIRLGASQSSAPITAHATNFASVVVHYGLQLGALGNGPTIAPFTPLPAAQAWTATAALALCSVLLAVRAFRLNGASNLALFGWLLFLVALAPHVISVPSIGLYGNRYGYFALYGLATCAAGLCASVRRPLTERALRMLRVGVTALCPLLALRTSAEAAHWRSNLTLFAADVARDPNNGQALYHLGTAVLTAQGCAKALPLFLRATELAPSYERAWHNAAGCLIDLGRASEAEPFAERAAELAPYNARARFNLGLALAARGDQERAAEQLRVALRLEPGYARARDALARLEAGPGSDREPQR